MVLNPADRISWDRFYAAALHVAYLEAAALPDSSLNSIKKTKMAIMGEAAQMADRMLEQQRKR